MIEARNQADGLAHGAETQLKEHGDKIGDSDKAEIEQAISAVRTAVQGEDAADIRAKTDALGQASMKIGEAIYRASQEAEGAGSAEGSDQTAEASDDTVVDADFEEVDESDETDEADSNDTDEKRSA